MNDRILFSLFAAFVIVPLTLPWHISRLLRKRSQEIAQHLLFDQRILSMEFYIPPEFRLVRDEIFKIVNGKTGNHDTALTKYAVVKSKVSSWFRGGTIILDISPVIEGNSSHTLNDSAMVFSVLLKYKHSIKHARLEVYKSELLPCKNT